MTYFIIIYKQIINYTGEDLNPHPPRGAPYKSVTGNTVEESSALRIEFFMGVKGKGSQGKPTVSLLPIIVN